MTGRYPRQDESSTSPRPSSIREPILPKHPQTDPGSYLVGKLVALPDGRTGEVQPESRGPRIFVKLDDGSYHYVAWIGCDFVRIGQLKAILAELEPRELQALGLLSRRTRVYDELTLDSLVGRCLAQELPLGQGYVISPRGRSVLRQYEQESRVG